MQDQRINNSSMVGGTVRARTERALSLARTASTGPARALAYITPSSWGLNHDQADPKDVLNDGSEAKADIEPDAAGHPDDSQARSAIDPSDASLSRVQTHARGSSKWNMNLFSSIATALSFTNLLSRGQNRAKAVTKGVLDDGFEGTADIDSVAAGQQRDCHAQSATEHDKKCIAEFIRALIVCILSVCVFFTTIKFSHAMPRPVAQALVVLSYATIIVSILCILWALRPYRGAEHGTQASAA